jgi:hypothetical protein
MTDATAAHAALQELVRRAAAERPHLGLSFGYIGNLTPWRDDRSWRVFSKVAVRRSPHGSQLLYDWVPGGGDFATSLLPFMRGWVESEAFTRHLERLERQYAANAAAGRHDLNVATYQPTQTTH